MNVLQQIARFRIRSSPELADILQQLYKCKCQLELGAFRLYQCCPLYQCFQESVTLVWLEGVGSEEASGILETSNV